MLEKDVLMFIAGNFVEIVNIKTLEHTYIRSTSGQGIGALTVCISTFFYGKIYPSVSHIEGKIHKYAVIVMIISTLGFTLYCHKNIMSISGDFAISIFMTKILDDSLYF